MDVAIATDDVAAAAVSSEGGSSTTSSRVEVGNGSCNGSSSSKMESGLSHEHRAHRHHSRVRLRRLVIAHVAFRRRLLRALVLVAAAAAAAVVVIVLVQENGGGGGGAGYAGAGDDGLERKKSTWTLMFGMQTSL